MIARNREKTPEEIKKQENLRTIHTLIKTTRADIEREFPNHPEGVYS